MGEKKSNKMKVNFSIFSSIVAVFLRCWLEFTEIDSVAIENSLGLGHNFVADGRGSCQQPAEFKLEEAHVTARIDNGELVIVCIQNLVISTRTAGEKEIQ